MSISGLLNCKYANICGGCRNISIAYEKQLSDKKAYIENLLLNTLGDKLDINVYAVDKGYLRDRSDLTIYKQNGVMVLGLYDLNKEKIIDLEECHQMSPALWQAVSRLRDDLPDIDLGSVRVRVSPSGEIGLWLDFPNQTVKTLLEQRSWFSRILDWAYVEVGQKRKRLVYEGLEHKLLEGEYHPWFESYVGEYYEPFPLYMKVGGFSQPGFRANKKMMQIIDSLISNKMNILELCCGSGNFSFHLASMGHKVHAIDFDKFSIEAITKSLNTFNWKENLVVEKKNIYSKNLEADSLFKDKDMVLADPPRSGLGKILDLMKSVNNKPKNFLYISCFPKSFIEDVKTLKEMGYNIKNLSILDQFPQSDHMEIISLLEL